MQKNIVISVLEIPKPMASLGVALPMLDLNPARANNYYWRKRDISHKQMAYMKSFGVVVTPSDFAQFNQGDASDVIDALASRKSQRARLEYHLEQANRLLENDRAF